MENTIEFKGPFNINHLDKDLEKKINNPGIYIWGFMVDSKYNTLNCKNIKEFNSEKMSFLPYYVGMATGKSDMTIYKRLKKHKEVTKSDAAKYTRLSKKHLKTFYNDPLFPLHFDNESSKKYLNKLLIYNLNHDNKAISYFNNPMFMFFLYQKKLINKLDELFKNHEPNNVPITLDTFKDWIDDPLDEIVNNKNNFWFCYADDRSYENKNANDNEIRAFYESLESLTYYSLKGKTISKTKKFETISDNIQVKCNDNLINIFKEKVLTKEIIKKKYLNEKNEVEFPGY